MFECVEEADAVGVAHVVGELLGWEPGDFARFGGRLSLAADDLAAEAISGAAENASEPRNDESPAFARLSGQRAREDSNL